MKPLTVWFPAVAAAAALLLVLSPDARSSPPGVIHYQGVLRDASGAVLHCVDVDNCPSGAVSITFRLYSASTAGTAVWTEIQSDVVVDQGVFHVLLGEGDALTWQDLDTPEVWLGVEVNSDGEMTPRQRVVSSAYAIYCDRAVMSANSNQLGGVDATLYVLESELQTAGYTTLTEVIAWLNANPLPPTDPISGLGCEPGDVAVADGAGSWMCVAEQGVAPKQCPAGTVATGVSASGEIVCDPVLPAGAVMFFDLPSCPPGWSAFGPGQGRALVGTPLGGTQAGTTGAPIADLAPPTHAHQVAQATVTSATAGAHNHTVDPAVATSSEVHVNHSHKVVVGSKTTSVNTHRHKWAWFNAGEAWHTFQAAGNGVFNDVTLKDYDTSQGLADSDFDGGVNYPLVRRGNLASGNIDYYTGETGHSHTVDYGTIESVTTTGGNSATLHSHAVDVAATSSTSDGDHAHGVTIPSATTQGASGALPFAQLTICRKD